MKKITGSNDVGFGHFGTLGYVLSGAIGQVVGKGSKSTEEMDLPKNLSFLRDSSISISLTMMVIYFILAIASGSEYVTTQFSNGQHYWCMPVFKPLLLRRECSLFYKGCV